MRRSIMLLLAASVAALLPLQPSAQTSNGATQDGVPSVTDPSIPLSYVGNDGSVSLGINSEGKTEGQLLGVFARNNERALVGQLWWDRNGAGGVQSDFNWLWGMTALEARERPDDVTVARLSFAIDQNAEHDRKATFGFGIERRDYSLEGYLARGISSARAAGSSLHSDAATVNGSDTIGSYAQVETTAIETLFASKPYGTEVGLQLSHVFEPWAMRVHGGASLQDGDGARANTFSLGLDTPLGKRGWGMSALGEHVSRHGGLDTQSDDRVSVYLRYEFGGHGSFVPTSQLDDPAWVSRSLARPSSAHPRIVESHRVTRSKTVSVIHGPKQYTNRFPLLHDDNASAANGQPVTLDVLANDSDPDGDPLVLSAVTAPAHGTAVISGARIVYTPSNGFAGADSFHYTVSDGRGGTATATVTMAVAAAQVNQLPLARNDNATAAFGKSTTVDVLANDSDPDGDSLALVSVDAPLHGTAVVSGRNVIYTPTLGFSGADRVTYTISDGRGGTAIAVIVITVAMRPNRAPVARADTATAVFGQLTTIDVLANDYDIDGDPLSVIAVTSAAHGTVTISGSSLLYAPGAGFVGTDNFRYTITDGNGGSASAVVTINVAPLPNRPPVAVADAATTAFAQPVTISVLANDSDPDGDALSIVSVTAPLMGTAVISGNTVTYTPGAAGALGTDQFTYTISDGRGGTATANVTVTISTLANQPPQAVDDTANAAFGQPVTVAVLGNDSDPDGDTLSIIGVTAPTSGTVVISGNVVVYTPAAGFSGIDRFAYTISDGRGGTASAFVTVVVAAVPNQPPTAVNDAVLTPANTPVTINVLANDTDPDGDPLSIIGVTQPANGTAVVTPNGITYTPNAGFLGFDQFTYTISDGRGGIATAAAAVFVNG
ncbi:MAG: Ig-like domain-containing protein [Dokdonella sp.]